MFQEKKRQNISCVAQNDDPRNANSLFESNLLSKEKRIASLYNGYTQDHCSNRFFCISSKFFFEDLTRPYQLVLEISVLKI